MMPNTQLNLYVAFKTINIVKTYPTAANEEIFTFPIRYFNVLVPHKTR